MGGLLSRCLKPILSSRLDDSQIADSQQPLTQQQGAQFTGSIPAHGKPLPGPGAPVADITQELFRKKAAMSGDTSNISWKTNKIVRKLPGTITGRAYALSDLNCCDVYLLDCLRHLRIDDCHDSVFVVGPVETKITVRDCSNCTFVVPCSECVCRDLRNCRLLLHCSSAPVVEASTGVAVACYDFGYRGLAQQLEAVGLSPFVNSWHSVTASAPRVATDWTFLEPGLTSDLVARSLNHRMPNEVAALICPERATFVTTGDKSAAAADVGGFAFVLVSEAGLKAANSLPNDLFAHLTLAHIVQGAKVLLAHKGVLDDGGAAAVVRAAGWPEEQRAGLVGKCWVCEVYNCHVDQVSQRAASHHAVVARSSAAAAAFHQSVAPQ